jgi:hypothetical protein
MVDNRKVVALAAPKVVEPAAAIYETDGPDPQFLHSVLCQDLASAQPTRDTMFTRSCGVRLHPAGISPGSVSGDRCRGRG